MRSDEIRKLPTSPFSGPGIPSEFECQTIIMRELAAQLAELNWQHECAHSVKVADELADRIPGTHLYGIIYGSSNPRVSRIRTFTAEDALCIFRQSHPGSARFASIIMMPNQNDGESDGPYEP